MSSKEAGIVKGMVELCSSHCRRRRRGDHVVRPASAQEIHGTPGAPNSTITIDGHVLPPPPQKFGGEIELNAAQSKPYWPASVVPPKGAPNILLIMTDDVGFARALDLRRRHPDAGARSHRQQRPALHQLPLDVALLADARRADHRPQPPFGRLRRRLRGGERLPRLQQPHRQGQRHHRPHPARERLPHRVVRQGPQHPDLPDEPGRAVRSMAERNGF